MESATHENRGSWARDSKGRADTKLMGIGKNISSCVFVKEGDASVLGRSSMSWGISGVTGQVLQMESAYSSGCYSRVLEVCSHHLSFCRLYHTTLRESDFASNVPWLQGESWGGYFGKRGLVFLQMELESRGCLWNYCTSLNKADLFPLPFLLVWQLA